MDNLPDFFACPECQGSLSTGEVGLGCPQGHEFHFESGVANFLARPNQARTVVEGAYDAAIEHSGMLRRVEEYLEPWIRSGRREGPIRVLEDGCGVGTTVLALNDRGIDAWGIDPGFRQARWAEGGRGRLHVADGTKLPFIDQCFDFVTSTGVLEHVGEGEGKMFRHEDRALFIREAIRVLRPGGRALFGQPNGAHPFDFWHPGRFSIRVHRPYEKWMPTAGAIRRWVREAPYQVELRFLPPTNYLGFERIKEHAYGRWLNAPARAFVNSLERWPRLVAGPLNPFLVAEVTRLT